MATYNNLAIIPARENSKRVPRKNMETLGEYPLYWHTMLSALHTPEIDAIVLSSESPTILKDAKIRLIAKYGIPATGRLFKNKLSVDNKTVYLYKRPSELSQDFVQVSEVALNVLRSVQYNNHKVKNVIILQPTSPFRNWETVQDAILTFGDICARKGTLFTAYQDNGFHWRIEHSDINDITPLGHNPERRFGGQDEFQDYSIVRENGALYIISAETFSLNTVMRVPPFHALVVDDNVDIDTPDDFSKARSMIGK